jgi:hypothetical protein
MLVDTIMLNIHCSCLGYVRDCSRPGEEIISMSRATLIIQSMNALTIAKRMHSLFTDFNFFSKMVKK